MPRGRIGANTPKTKSFRFTAADSARLEEAQRLMGLESQADVIRALVSRYLDEHRQGRTQRDHARAATVELLEEQLPGRVELLVRQLGPAIVAEVLAELLAQGVKRQR